MPPPRFRQSIRQDIAENPGRYSVHDLMAAYQCDARVIYKARREVNGVLRDEWREQLRDTFTRMVEAVKQAPDTPSAELAERFGVNQRYACRILKKYGQPVRTPKPWCPEQNAAVLAIKYAEDYHKVAHKLGRTVDAIRNQHRRLRLQLSDARHEPPSLERQPNQ